MLDELSVLDELLLLLFGLDELDELDELVVQSASRLYLQPHPPA